jgi:hypothetical protein
MHLPAWLAMLAPDDTMTLTQVTALLEELIENANLRLQLKDRVIEDKLQLLAQAEQREAAFVWEVVEAGIAVSCPRIIVQSMVKACFPYYDGMPIGAEDGVQPTHRQVRLRAGQGAASDPQRALLQALCSS